MRLTWPAPEPADGEEPQEPLVIVVPVVSEEMEDGGHQYSFKVPGAAEGEASVELAVNGQQFEACEHKLTWAPAP